MKQLLLVEDNVALGQGISLALQSEQIKVTHCTSLGEARAQWQSQSFDLVLLDCNLPDGNGIIFLKELRTQSSLPIIMLTANDMELDIVTGLESGADDYITKPFSLAVLRARVNTQLRKSTAAETTIYLDGFSFDFTAMDFRKNGQPLELSKTEQKLLRLLVENRGQILPRNLLIDRVWTDGAEYVDENALSVSMKRLRDKLEDVPAKPQYIKTVYGLGYTWAVNRHA